MASEPAVVTWDYEPTGANQLKLSKGQKITIFGAPNADGWIEAQSGAKKGWIPSGYYEPTGEGASGGTTGSTKPSRPPPKPSTVGSSAGVGSASSAGGKVMNAKDASAIFAYQAEWWTILTTVFGSIIVFMNGTTEPDARVVLMSLTAIFLVSALAVNSASSRAESPYPCRFFMDSSKSQLARVLYWALIMITLAAAYPVGVFVAGPIFVLLCIEAWAWHGDIGMPSYDNSENWLNAWEWLCCGPNCTSGRLSTTAVIFVVNIFAGVWGYIEGSARADKMTDSLNNWDIRPAPYGLQTCFGRMLTINLVCIALISLKTCCGEPETGAGSLTGLRGICSPWLNRDTRSMLHRVFGYFAAVTMLLHCLFAYYAYELSGQTHTYNDVFGYVVYVTGGLALLIFGLVIASASAPLWREQKALFKWVHPFAAWVFLVLLIFHGRNGVNTKAWYILLVPVVFYTGDLFMRLAQDIGNANPRQEF
jgi:hypothetical protein